MTYYYTPNKRDHSIYQVGFAPIDLHIPPKQKNWEVTGLCTAACGREAINDTTRYITEATAHMHYLGEWSGHDKQ